MGLKPYAIIYSKDKHVWNWLGVRSLDEAIGYMILANCLGYTCRIEVKYMY